MEIKEKILNCFAIAFVSTLFIFAFTWIIFDFQNSDNTLKDTWGIVSSLFGGITTLIAAYIASLLFNDWRVQKTYELEKEYIEKLSVCLFEIYQSIFSQSSQISFMYNCHNKHNQYTILKLDNVDFLSVSEKDKTCHYLSSIISTIIQDSKLEKKLP